MKKFLIKLAPLFSIIAFLPLFASASGACDNVADPSLVGLKLIICQVQVLLNSIVPVLVALGVVYFIWGVVNYVIADSEEVKKRGRDQMLYGVIGLAVIIGMWGLVKILGTTFGVESGNTNNATPGISLLPVGQNCSSLGANSKFQDVLCFVTKIINDSVIPLIFAVAVLSFVWGVVQFVINNGEEAKREKGRQFMIWGIIALAVMISVWGLVRILGSTFGLDVSFIPRVCPPGQNPCP